MSKRKELKKQLLMVFEKENKEAVGALMHRIEHEAAKGKDELIIEKKKKTKHIYRLFIDKNNRLNRHAVAYFMWRGFDVSVGMHRISISWCDVELDDACDCDCEEEHEIHTED